VELQDIDKGNSSILHERMSRTRATSGSERCIGGATLLSKFEKSPEVKPKMAKAAFIVSRSHSLGVTKRTRSSA
jgi:hypothetical protein